MIPARISWVFGFRHFLFPFEYFIQLKFDFYRCFLNNIYHFVGLCSHIAIYFSIFIREFYFIFRVLFGISKFLLFFFLNLSVLKPFSKLNRVRYFFRIQLAMNYYPTSATKLTLALLRLITEFHFRRECIFISKFEC